MPQDAPPNATPATRSPWPRSTSTHTGRGSTARRSLPADTPDVAQKAYRTGGLIATTVLGVAFGPATSAAVSAAMGQRWSGPGPGFAMTVVAGVALALAMSTTALPLVRSATEHDAVRLE